MRRDIEALLRVGAGDTPSDVPFEVVWRRGRRRRLARYAVTGATTLMLAVGSVAGVHFILGQSPSNRSPASTHSPSPRPSNMAPSPSVPEPQGDVWSRLPTGWTSLRKPPITRSDAVTAWTGRELFYWSGEPPGHADGALYDEQSGEWRALAKAPISARDGSASVWTGEEVLLWGGAGYRGLKGDGAAYDPKGDSWRVLSPAPLGPRVPLVSVWTGTEMIVWGGSDRYGRVGELTDGAAYNPATNTWRKIADAPLEMDQASAVWTGSEMIVYGAKSLVSQDGLAYDPVRDEWRSIPFFGLSAPISTVWTDRGMVAWDREGTAGLYDPDAGTWRNLSGLPPMGYECYPSSAYTLDTVVAWNCGQAATLNLSERSWQPLAPPTV